MDKPWEVISLGDIIDPKRPITYGVVQPGEHDPNGIPLVRGGDFSAGWRPIEEYRKVSPKVERAFARARLRAGDIVITIKGDVGTAAIVPDFLTGANLSQTNARLAIDDSKAEPELVLAFLQSREGRKQIAAVTQIGAQPGLIFPDILSLQLRLPPLTQQRKIAAILRASDLAIAATDAAIAAKRQARQAIAARLFFSGSRAERFFQYPDDAELRPIGSFAQQISQNAGGGTPPPPVFSCTKHAGLVPSAEYFGRRVHSADVSGYRFVDIGDFCYATNHIEEGSIGLMSAPTGGLVSPMYTVFRITDPTVDRHFLIELLKTETMRRMFQRNTSASVDRRGGLRWEEFAKITVPIPSLARQQLIASALSEMRQEINLLTAQVRALRNQKRGLMQKLLTGEWRVDRAQQLQAAE